MTRFWSGNLCGVAMRDEEKSKPQLIEELQCLRRWIRVLQADATLQGASGGPWEDNDIEDDSSDLACSELVWDPEDMNLPVLDTDPRYDGEPQLLNVGLAPPGIPAQMGSLSRNVTETGSYDLTWMTLSSFGKLLDAIPMPILLVDPFGALKHANSAFLKIADDPAAGLSGDLFALFADPSEAGQARELLRKAFSERKPQVTEGPLRAADKEIWGRMNLRSIRFGSDRSVLVLIEDLTTEKRELSINEKYGKLVHIFPIGIGEFLFPEHVLCAEPCDRMLSVLLSARLVDANGQFALFSGYESVAEVQGRTFGEILPCAGQDLAFYRSWIESRFSVSHFETKEEAATGDWRYFENTLVGNVQRGCLIQFWAMKQDVTERRKVEEELVEKIRTIDELYEHIIQSGKAKAIAEHTATVAHELRQPLAIIGGFARRMAAASAANSRGETESQTEGFQIIIKEVQRLEKVLERLIDYTRHDSLQLERVNPNDIIEYVLKINVGRIREKDLRVETELGPEVGEIPLDPDRFQQVVRYLVANAIEASEPGQTIRIETGISIPGEKAHKSGELLEDKYFEIKVHNHGQRIPPEDLEKIFNPFFTTKGYGTGLGLTLAKKIVEDHKGSISVLSDEDGTLTTVWVPLK